MERAVPKRGQPTPNKYANHSLGGRWFSVVTSERKRQKIFFVSLFWQKQRHVCMINCDTLSCNNCIFWFQIRWTLKLFNLIVTHLLGSLPAVEKHCFTQYYNKTTSNWIVCGWPQNHNLWNLWIKIEDSCFL